VIEDTAGVYVSQRLLSQTVTFILLSDPSGKRLFHNPATRTFKPRSHLIYLIGHRERYMRGQHFGCLRHSDELKAFDNLIVVINIESVKLPAGMEDQEQRRR
jgi:hypothetical protein